MKWVSMANQLHASPGNMLSEVTNDVKQSDEFGFGGCQENATYEKIQVPTWKPLPPDEDGLQLHVGTVKMALVINRC